MQSKVDQLLNLARRGPVRARDLDAAGIPRTYLLRLCKRGLLERIDRGLYGLVGAEVTELHSIAVVAKRVPHATICLISALQIHGLTPEAPHAVWLMIDRHAHMPRWQRPSRRSSLSGSQLEVVRASGRARDHDVQRRLIEGVEVRLTGPAKTVADCFRYRSRVGLDVALEALRDFLRRSRGRTLRGTVPRVAEGMAHDSAWSGSRMDDQGDPQVTDIDALIRAARADRVYTLMRPYLEALALGAV